MAMVKNIFGAVFGRSKLDPAFRLDDHPRLLHISDTPSQFYPELKRIINVLEPDYIIHTGDLADNIKIGLYRSSFHRYKHEVRIILKILQDSKAKKIVLSLGNHDDYDFVRKHSGRLLVFDGWGKMEFEGIDIAFSHYYSDLKDLTADLRLYGHDLDSTDDDRNKEKDLNGIASMSLIDLVTLDVKKIEYPFGTNNSRLNRNKLGI